MKLRPIKVQGVNSFLCASIYFSFSPLRASPGDGGSEDRRGGQERKDKSSGIR
jgi:hypothetical protein